MENQKKNPSIVPIIVIVLLLAIAIGVYYYLSLNGKLAKYAKVVNPPTISEVPDYALPTVAPITDESAASLTTGFLSKELGITFDYPASWNTPTLTKNTDDNELNLNDEIIITRGNYKDALSGKDMTIDDLINQAQPENQADISDTVIGGVKSKKFVYTVSDASQTNLILVPLTKSSEILSISYASFDNDPSEVQKIEKVNSSLKFLE